jgi:glycosyltransferase involved in cell wall biosynthesis
MRHIQRLGDALGHLGIHVSRFDIWAQEHREEIVHLFGYTHELSAFARFAKLAGKAVVISPIAYPSHPFLRRGWGLVDGFVPVQTSHRAMRQLFAHADAILPSCVAEAEALAVAFAVPEQKMIVVPHCVDRELANADTGPFRAVFGTEEFVLEVGRISRRKRQIEVMRALDGAGIPLVFIGYPAPYECEYFKSFKREAAGREWVTYLGVVSDELLRSALASAKVHVLPSVDENPGLSSLEAGMAGANVVAVGSRPVVEHLGGDALYCKPHSFRSLRETILRAYEAPRDRRLQARLLSGFTWERAASQVAAVYKRLATQGQGMS